MLCRLLARRTSGLKASGREVPELTWDGKYDADGKRAAPVRLALPFQTVETVNESAQQRQRALDFFADEHEIEWRNRLVWGDKKYVLPALVGELAGQVDLIYIDPPFATGADFSFLTSVPEALQSFTKEPSVIEQKAYRDTWGRGLDGYLEWFYEGSMFLRELLKPTGSVYVHLDWHVAPYARAILDEVLGAQNFRTEIVWKRTTAHSDSKTWSHVTDMILFYTMSPTFTWNPPYADHADKYLAAKYNSVDADGRQYTLDNLTSPNPRPNLTYEWKGFQPPAFGWRYSKETMADLASRGRIWYPEDKSKRPRLKRFLDESKGRIVDNLWDDIPPVNSQAQDRTGIARRSPRPSSSVSSRRRPIPVTLCWTASAARAQRQLLQRHWAASGLRPTSGALPFRRRANGCCLSEASDRSSFRTSASTSVSSGRPPSSGTLRRPARPRTRASSSTCITQPRLLDTRGCTDSRTVAWCTLARLMRPLPSATSRRS